ncbi:ATP-binding protein [Streptomyces sp. B6B3]|uniref:ATP-binding protein n=1 Tax=Streptomyces sp. B6B3 TaxID=3153570 RepID=UPI00325EB00D
MKQATVKSLGAAALGAAIAVTAAGTASAAITDGVHETAGELVSTLPLEEAANELPGESGEVVDAGRRVLTGEAKLPLTDDTLAGTQSATAGQIPSTSGDLSTTTGDLLGGLPVGSSALNNGLPVQGLPL